MKIKILLILLALFQQQIFSQTNVSGGIFSDQTWTELNSPYIVTGDIVVFQSKTLTIEPGVEIKFDGGFSLEVRGTIISEGTELKPIKFTSNLSNKNAGDWNGLSVKNLLGGNGSFEYCEFYYASSVMNVSCCDSSNSVSFENCLFQYNISVLSGYTGGDMIVDNCTFLNNTYCISSADKTITNSTFSNNTYGLHSTERISVYNSLFEDNETALYGGRGIIEGCTIQNNITGVKAFFEGFTLTSNIIINNGVGIELGSYDGYTPSVKNNEICNNTSFNVKNNNSSTKDMTDNCWCTDSESEIELKLFDAYDDINYGLINYSIYDEECINITSEVIKDITLSNNDYDTKNNFIKVFPNPFTNNIKVESTSIDFELIQIYSFGGELVYEELYSKTVSLDDLSSGVYFIKLISKGNNEIIKRIVKQ